MIVVRRPYGDCAYFDVYRAAEELEMPILMHMGVIGGGVDYSITHPCRDPEAAQRVLGSGKTGQAHSPEPPAVSAQAAPGDSWGSVPTSWSAKTSRSRCFGDTDATVPHGYDREQLPKPPPYRRAHGWYWKLRRDRGSRHQSRTYLRLGWFDRRWASPHPLSERGRDLFGEAEPIYASAPTTSATR